jgi:hypothetical protein
LISFGLIWRILPAAGKMDSMGIGLCIATLVVVPALYDYDPLIGVWLALDRIDKPVLFGNAA